MSCKQHQKACTSSVHGMKTGRAYIHRYSLSEINIYIYMYISVKVAGLSTDKKTPLYDPVSMLIWKTLFQSNEPLPRSKSRRTSFTTKPYGVHSETSSRPPQLGPSSVRWPQDHVKVVTLIGNHIPKILLLT